MCRVTALLFFLAIALLVASTGAGVKAAEVPATPSYSGATRNTASGDEEVLTRVQAALREDRYFYDAHVTVSVEHGNVILCGFVFSDWDLRDAIRIATKAAGGRRVIDSLAIEVGGRR
jgi:osmotically-inducible protein OsmY